MNEEKGEQKFTEKFRLNKYYYVVEISTLIALLVCGIILHSFRDSLTWLRYPDLNLWLFIGMFSFDFIFFILHEIFKKNIFFTFTRYGFIVFFIAILYTAGGIESAFSLMLFFPLIVSAVDLDEKMTKRVGIIMTTLFALSIFADPAYYHSFSIVIAHIVRVILFGLVSFFMYRIVKETLRQQYEKEEAKRKFIELAEADKVKTDFLTVAEHRLRTPLTAANWGIETVIRDHDLPSSSKEVLHEITKRIDESISIVNEMLKTAEYDMKGLKVEKGPIDMVELLNKVIMELEFLSKKNNVSVSVKSSGGIRCLVEGDRKLFDIAFTNVIDNAIRYSPGGKVDISIDCETARIVVKDTGVGIDKEDLPNIFERFYRGKNAIAIDPNESGVGLYITKKIIELNGGSVSLQSESGKGTTITVEFLC